MGIKSIKQQGLIGFDTTLLKSQGFKAIGGVVTESGNYRIHTFTGSGQFTVLDQNLNVEYLIVGGGGSGGNCQGNSGTPGGGGGAGGVLIGSMVLNRQSYPITIGGGGASQTTTGLAGINGTNTIALGLISYGGGGGGGDDVNSPFGADSPARRRGKTGGSGGGGSNESPIPAEPIFGQGNYGGSSEYCAGGGGAGEIGNGAFYNTSGGTGGNGITCSINGTTTTYGGGGGAGGSVSQGSTGGPGGTGGGGAGASRIGSGVVSNATNGSTNTGGGGGGGAANGGTTSNSGAGGSGIVIIRYLKDKDKSTTFTTTKPIINDLVLNLDATNHTSFPGTLQVEYVVVAGGGGGGVDRGGGGGAGGYRSSVKGENSGTATQAEQTVILQPGTSYTVTVGAGGSGAVGGNGIPTIGSNSVFGSITSYGGGRGSTYPTDLNNFYRIPSAGGSGGGGFHSNASPSDVGGKGFPGQGGDGSARANVNISGGGGGASGNASNQDGSAGITTNISGTPVTYGGGGGGAASSSNTPGVGGAGGGGNGKNGDNNSAGDNATANTGGGGGGGTGGGGGGGGNGGSGIVIIRYPGIQRALGGTVTSSNGYTIHTFTSSGSFTTYKDWDNNRNYVWNDLSTYKNHGVLIATGTTFDATDGGVIKFDGVKTQILNIPVTHSHLSSSAIEVIFKPTTNNTRMSLGGYRHNGGYSNGTIGWLYIRENNEIWASVITAAQVYVVAQTTGTYISLNQYHHVVYNKNTSTGLMEIYINGVLCGSANFDVATYAQWTSAGSYIGSNIIDIGKSFNTNSGQNWNLDFFKGDMPLFKLYSRVMSATEILQNYNSYKNKYGF
jgi:hypothetical protein